MATIVNEAELGSATDIDTYTTGSFTAGVGALLFVVVAATTTTAAAPVLTASLGTTFTLVASGTERGGVDTVYFFVGNRREISALAQTCTVVLTGDAAESAIVHIHSITGMVRSGMSAVRQSVVESEVSNVAPPDVVFPAVTLSENPTFSAVANASIVNVTIPVGWTGGHATAPSPVSIALRGAFLSSGFASSTITWDSLPVGTTCVIFGVEFDTSPANRVLSTGVGL